MIVEMDLKGELKWVVVDKDLVIVDPNWSDEYKMYNYRMSVLFYVDKQLAM